MVKFAESIKTDYSVPTASTICPLPSAELPSCVPVADGIDQLHTLKWVKSAKLSILDNSFYFPCFSAITEALPSPHY